MNYRRDKLAAAAAAPIKSKQKWLKLQRNVFSQPSLG